jgi:transcription termination factor Rho
MKTAVEWFEVELESISVDFSGGLITFKEFIEQYEKLLKQAKEMEKQQIVDAITQYQIKHNKIYSEQGILNVVDNAMQYYTETFKSK